MKDPPPCLSQPQPAGSSAAADGCARLGRPGCGGPPPPQAPRRTARPRARPSIVSRAAPPALVAGTCLRRGARGRRRNAPHLHRGVGSSGPGGSRPRRLSAACPRRRGRLVRRRRSLLPGGHDPSPQTALGRDAGRASARLAARPRRAARRRGRAAAIRARCATGGGGPSRCRPGFLGGIPPTRNRAGNPLSREPGLNVRRGGSERVASRLLLFLLLGRPLAPLLSHPPSRARPRNSRTGAGLPRARERLCGPVTERRVLRAARGGGAGEGGGTSAVASRVRRQSRLVARPGHTCVLVRASCSLRQSPRPSTLHAP